MATEGDRAGMSRTGRARGTPTLSGWVFADRSGSEEPESPVLGVVARQGLGNSAVYARPSTGRSGRSGPIWGSVLRHRNQRRPITREGASTVSGPDHGRFSQPWLSIDLPERACVRLQSWTFACE